MLGRKPYESLISYAAGTSPSRAFDGSPSAVFSFSMARGRARDDGPEEGSSRSGGDRDDGSAHFWSPATAAEG